VDVGPLGLGEPVVGTPIRSGALLSQTVLSPSTTFSLAPMTEVT
jgi:hypothetical protein